MASKAYHLVAGGFAGMTAPFGVHPKDRERAAAYRDEAVRQGVTWAEAEQDIRTYLTEQGCTAEMIQSEVNRARPLLQPWLS